MGEPTKFTFAKQHDYLEMRRLGVGKGAAAIGVGMTRQGIGNHAKKYPKFAQLDKEASELATDFVESALFQSAIKGNVTAQQVWLYNRRPNQWKDMRAQRFMPDDATVASLENVSTEDLRKVLDAHTSVREAIENGENGANGHGNGAADGGSSEVH